jgi:hypothetical protein
MSEQQSQALSEFAMELAERARTYRAQGAAAGRGYCQRSMYEAARKYEAMVADIADRLIRNELKKEH